VSDVRRNRTACRTVGQRRAGHLVDTRITPDVIPEGNPLPAVVYQRAGTTAVSTIHDGQPIAEEVRFQVSAWAPTRTAADAVADEVANALAVVGVSVADRSSGIDPESDLKSATVEVDWWHVF
jgi:hypothetical protein